MEAIEPVRVIKESSLRYFRPVDLKQKLMRLGYVKVKLKVIKSRMKIFEEKHSLNSFRVGILMSTFFFSFFSSGDSLI